MKYLIVATKYGNKDNKWLTNELSEVINTDGNDVYVLALSWLDSEDESSIKVEDGITIYRCKMPSFFYKKNILIKYLKQIIFPVYAYYKYKNKIEKIGFDRVIAFSPSHLVDFIISNIKKRNDIKCYLILWDFFPFYLNEMLSKKFLFKCLKSFENKSYTRFDKIGVMTDGNKSFLLENYKGISSKVIDILPIWAKITDVHSDDKIRLKYGLNCDDFIFVYGGAHSRIQELDNLLDLAKLHLDNKIVKFVFIGKGDDKERLKNKVDLECINNVIFLDFIPRSEYEILIKSMDVGLVCLSKNLIVPSFPSKSLDYLKCSLPILASIDRVTDYGNIMVNKMKCGYFSYSGDTLDLYEKSIRLIDDKISCKKMGKNGRKYFEENFSVDNVYKIIDESLI